MKTSDSPNSNKKELEQPDFSKPTCWCESTAHYTNSHGQEFDLRVRGTNTDAIEEFIHAVRISFEVKPFQESLPEESEITRQEYQKNMDADADALKSIELHHELDLEIEVDVINTQGIELPYVLSGTIDPPICGGATQKYCTAQNVKNIHVTVTASAGGVSTALSGGGNSWGPKQADTFPPDPPTRTALLSGSTMQNSKFTCSVTGLKLNNSYTINSDVTLVRIS